MKSILTAVAAGALMVAPVVAFAQTNGSGIQNSGNDNQSMTLTQHDKQFLRNDARSGAAEMQMSRLAEQKAANQQIKQFAQKDIGQHAATEQTAQQLAQQAGITLPTQPTSHQQNEIKSLRNKSGQQFDQAYLKDMQQLNNKSVKHERTEAQRAQNPQLRSFAQQAESTDQQHLNDVRSLESSVG